MKRGSRGLSGREEVAAMKEMEMAVLNQKTSDTISQLLQHKESKEKETTGKIKKHGKILFYSL